ncbi:hypothetical protein HCN44_005460 [Aphidius gifuensis]|uniref:Ribosomal RNA-processing protein 14/surfeit locus protein 6 C-terminal domain-containing protein n=1 Tax=Aphidius gifuensis TaxID=684658 RepID=A0A834Y0Z4_APHGI|nr:hypothetical protein HCN44_005460 [Aphidius gifuensis]
MQLKMSNTFNAKSVKQLLQVEDTFISELFTTMPIPARETEPQQKNSKLFLKKGDPKRAATFTELHEKLDSLKGVKKLSHKLKLEKKGLKNRLKKKTRRNEHKAQTKAARIEKLNSGKNIKTEDVEGAPKATRSKPVFNSEGHMVFSKFDFSEIGTKKKQQKNGKDPKKALEALQEKKEKIKSLVAAGETEKAQVLKEKDAWKSVLAKSSGEKVKDDTELLKKSIKREEQKKKGSAKKWENRLNATEKAIQERQQKRQDNIMKRKKDKKTNKLKKSAKKGRIIPGF